MRRIVLLLLAMAFALALVGGAAWAANITGDAGKISYKGRPTETIWTAKQTTIKWKA